MDDVAGQDADKTWPDTVSPAPTASREAESVWTDHAPTARQRIVLPVVNTASRLIAAALEWWFTPRASRVMDFEEEE